MVKRESIGESDEKINNAKCPFDFCPYFFIFYIEAYTFAFASNTAYVICDGSIAYCRYMLFEIITNLYWSQHAKVRHVECWHDAVLKLILTAD